MKRLLMWVCAMLLAPSAASGATRVVATLPTLAAVTQEMGGANVSVRALAAPTQDPHFVEPRPNLILDINHAELLIANGMELEIGWLPPLQVASRNDQVQAGGPAYVEVAQFINALEIPKGRIDRSMGDLHPGGNPHFLNDPARMAAIAIGIAQRLADVDPDHGDDYKKNAQAYADKLNTFAKAQASRFAALPDSARQVVTYHKSLVYLLTWLGLREVATLEPRPGVPPDPAHVAYVLSIVRSKKVPVIVQEEYYPVSTSKTLAELGHAQLVVIHGGVRFKEGEHYLDYLQKITDDLYAALAP